MGNEEIEVLYNCKYGGWGISKIAIDLYKYRNNLSEFNPEFCCRNDIILINIYKELGDNFDGKFSKTRIKRILKKYEHYYYIEEYDGKEYVRIDYNKFKLDNIYNKMKEILQKDICNDLKINQIEEFIFTLEI